MKPLIVDIKRNSLDDGPGIRTVIFFKGCPLTCVWCQNPETKSAAQEISFNVIDCLNCRKCLEVCENNAIDFLYKHRIYRDKCTLCGKCIENCPNEALKFAGKEYNINTLIDLLLQDQIFYKNSGGGITLSGGEPTLNIEYLNELLKELKKKNIHVCLETCGYYNREKFNKLILPYLDLIYFDLKLYDSSSHKEYCGVSNDLILQNFEDLINNSNVEILARIPLIPNITATKLNLLRLANYLKSIKVKKIGLLPYNPLWLTKMETIGIEPKYNLSNWLTKKEKKVIKDIFFDFKFKDF